MPVLVVCCKTFCYGNEHNLSLSHLPRIRGVGTAATNMCLVASGCVEAYYEIGIHCWDIAAGAIIVTEAGGVLMDVDGTSLYIPDST